MAVATLAGLEVETDPNFTMKDGAWKTPEFLAKFPFGYLPAFEGTDGTLLQESGAIADYCECGYWYWAWYPAFCCSAFHDETSFQLSLS